MNRNNSALALANLPVNFFLIVGFLKNIQSLIANFLFFFSPYLFFYYCYLIKPQLPAVYSDNHLEQEKLHCHLASTPLFITGSKKHNPLLSMLGWFSSAYGVCSARIWQLEGNYNPRTESPPKHQYVLENKTYGHACKSVIGNMQKGM